jgi:GNAT superfamily N-acetyltransferase
MSVPARAASRAGALTYRPVRTDEIETCAGIWRTAINDYVVLLGQGEIPPELNPLIRLFTHLQATDPERFIVATEPRPDAERVVAFAAAVSRERIWYLSMLFVLPEHQGAGVGRELLARVLPDDPLVARATATDSAQPISNALYAAHAAAQPFRAPGATGSVRRPSVRRRPGRVRHAGGRCAWGSRTSPPGRNDRRP